MSARDDDRDEAQISAELLEELHAEAQLLGIRDEVDDVALDLHEKPFSEDARKRAIALLHSPRYVEAAKAFRSLQGPAAQAGGL